jgi:hypothetical protein
VACGNADVGGSIEEAVKDLALMNKNAVITPGGTYRYLIKQNAPANVFLLYLPKNTDLRGLQRLYPRETAFDFSDEKALQILAGSALPKDVHRAYLDLLHRGGAIYIPRKDGKRIYLTVQPNQEVRQSVLD